VVIFPLILLRFFFPLHARTALSLGFIWYVIQTDLPYPRFLSVLPRFLIGPVGLHSPKAGLWTPFSPVVHGLTSFFGLLSRRGLGRTSSNRALFYKGSPRPLLLRTTGSLFS